MARKSAVVEEPEELDDDLELEDDADEDEDEAPAPKAKAKKTRKAPAATSEGYGISWLVDHVKETTDVDTTPAGLRILLRKMAKDETSPLAREVGEDRSRYSFTGENDKIVKAVVKAVKGGALTKAKSDGLAAARAAKEAKKAESASSAPASKKKGKAKAEPEEETAPAKATRRRRT